MGGGAGMFNQGGAVARMFDGSSPYSSGAGSSERYPGKTVSTTIQDGQYRGALTNLTGLVDAWGKPIPYTWGSVRVGGVGIWGSNYYENVSKFKTTTEFFNEYVIFEDQFFKQGGVTVEEKVDERITFDDKISYAIDLAYSFGFEGLAIARREIIRLRMNGKIIYDKPTGYIEPGLGFSFRYGYDSEVIPPIMSQYPDTGIYYYPGQTYVVFEKFQPALWGNSLPTSIDAEFEQLDATGANEKNPYPETVSHNNDRAIYHTARRRIYYVDNNEAGEPALHVYNLDTGARLEDIKLIGPAAQFVYDNFNTNFQGGSTADTGLFDVRFSINGLLDVYAIDLRSGYCQMIHYAYASSAFWYEGDQDHAICYTNGLLSPENWRRYELTRDAQGVVQVVITEVKVATHGQAFGPAGSWNGNGRGSVVGHYDGATARNKVVLWGKANGNDTTGIILDYGAPDGWRNTSAISYNDGCAMLVSRGDEQKMMIFNSVGKLIREKIIPLPDLGGRQFYLKDDNEGNRSIPSETYIAASNPFGYAVLWNLKQMTATIFPKPANSGAIIFDNGTNRLYYNIPGNPDFGALGAEHGLFGPGYVSSRIPLFEFMKSLYVTAGLYGPNQITQDGLIEDTIQGAMIVNNVNVNSIIQTICSLYRINKTETRFGVYFFKTRKSSTGLEIALQLTIDDLASDAEEVDESQVLKTRRANVNLTPTQIDLRFIDPNNDFKENEVSWRRTNAGQTRGVPLSLAIPFVLTQQEALRVVQGAVVDSETQANEHEFRLPPRYALRVVPGDIIQITHGRYRETIQLVDIDLNADFSASCKGVTVVNENVIEIPTPAYIAPAPIDLSSTLPSVGFVIDSPAINEADLSENGSFIQYEAIGPNAITGNYNGGYFGRKLAYSTVFESLPTIKSAAKLTLYRARSALSNKRWVKDSDGLPVQLLSGQHPAPLSNAQLQANGLVNLAWYGAPGRWEIIQFEGFFAGNLVGIIRGLRGTEENCGKHETGDYVILSEVSVLKETRPNQVVTTGGSEIYRPVSVGLPFGSVTDLPPIVIKGLSTYPFAPCSIKVVRQSNGDMLITWDRRDRKGSGWGDKVLPLSDERKYRVAVMDQAGTSEVFNTDVTEESFTYTVSEASNDGQANAEFLNLKIAQYGQLGLGFHKVEKINVR